MRARAGIALLLWFGAWSCGNATTRSSLTSGGSAGGSGTSGTSGVAGAAAGGGAGLDPSLGAACVDDAQCDDGIACTDDRCDALLARCRFTPVNDRCADGVYCNGQELCVLDQGCRAGEPVSCDVGGSACKVYRCIEATHTCESAPRDADADGDPVWNCGGTDCDDRDPLVNGKTSEICGNAIDDDCDGENDEDDCVAPAHDTCGDALPVEAAGSYELSLVAAKQDYALSCASDGTTRRDVVVALRVPAGEPADVDLILSSNDTGAALALSTSCTKRSELACSAATPLEGAGYVARLRAHELEPGTYPLFVSGLSDQSATLSVAFEPASPAPTNETCGSALELESNASVSVELAGAARDLESACGKSSADLVYRFELERRQDVRISALPIEDLGNVVVSLRDAGCSKLSDELDCRSSLPTALRARALEPGIYFIALAASGPSSLELSLETSEPSAAPADEGSCDPPELELGATQDLELGQRVNAVASSCLPGAADATYALDLAERSDVLLIERLSVGDTGALSLRPVGCPSGNERLCTSSAARALCTCAPWPGSVCSNSAPVRAHAYGLGPGRYAVTAESVLGAPAQLTAFSRPAGPETLVALADTCADALAIPERGGRFSGNTANANSDYSASCDYTSGDPKAAPDQILSLHLDSRKRVVFDAAGSDYATLVAVRKGPSCPGEELEGGCASGCAAARSLLDLTLDAGDYWVQVDGYFGASGQWLLDVYLADP